jgi:hypothetical protein
VPALFNARVSAALYNDNYKKGRVFRDHAMAYGVEMGKHPAIDAESLRKAGLAVREYLQNNYVLNHKLFIEQEEVNVAKIEIFGNCLRALTGSQQTTTSTDPKANPVMAAVGGAITGAMIGSMFGIPGMIVGGAIGAIVGLFG